MTVNSIEIRQAAEHNLAHVSLSIPRDKLVVFTGVSGSGKSSLAFDTIFSEGQRRYIQSLSAYARQFVGQFKKPEVESIEGLSPAISIDQKTASQSPRSTVGTVTEIYDYLRVLYARVGTPYCPECQHKIEPQSEQQIFEQILKRPDGTKLQIMAPIVRGRKGEYNALFQQFRKEGYSRVRVDGEILLLEELPETYRLARNQVHHIELIVDRIVLKNEERIHHRLFEALQTALKKSEGFVLIQDLSAPEDKPLFFSKHLACPSCDLSFDEMAPRLFSFNSPYGACETCEGLGLTYEIAEHLLIPDPDQSLLEGAIAPFEKITGRYYPTFIKKLGKAHQINLECPYRELSERERNFLLYGENLKKGAEKENPVDSGEDEDETDWFGLVSQFDGIMNILGRRLLHGSEGTKNYISSFMHEIPCPSCNGKRLKPIGLSVKLGSHSIDHLCRLSIQAAHQYLSGYCDFLSETQLLIGQQGLQEVLGRLQFLLDVGLDYLTLDRRSATLSGGEAQRIRLATQIGSGLSGVLYVLDEPSIGLHPHNNQQLIQTLQRLRDQGNSLIVVEHDEDTIRAADWVVDIGPGAGRHGGHIVAEGRPEEIEQNAQSLTGQYLSGKRRIEAAPKPSKQSVQKTEKTPAITIHGATRHNLKDIDIAFPLGKLICITGLSGSGKSTLIFDLLHPILKNHFNPHLVRPEGFTRVSGLDNVDKVIEIDQSPIGRSPRSNPVTYTGIFDSIRNVFASTEMAKMLGYSPGRFSFNVKTGRCEACNGDGQITLAMNFLPDASIPCDICEGKRYSAETLQVTYQGKNIADVLAMTVEEACDFFENQPKIQRYLTVLREVGLNYIQLGQAATTLSGGEAQRLKLATEFCRRSTGKTIYLLDEPSIGLHWQDLENLIGILKRLVEQGNTVIVIEHNLDLIKVADHVIDMGPEGGIRGGEICFSGSVHDLAQSKSSYTGKFLKSLL